MKPKAVTFFMPSSEQFECNDNSLIDTNELNSADFKLIYVKLANHLFHKMDDLLSYINLFFGPSSSLKKRHHAWNAIIQNDLMIKSKVLDLKDMYAIGKYMMINNRDLFKIATFNLHFDQMLFVAAKSSDLHLYTALKINKYWPLRFLMAEGDYQFLVKIFSALRAGQVKQLITMDNFWLYRCAMHNGFFQVQDLFPMFLSTAQRVQMAQSYAISSEATNVLHRYETSSQLDSSSKNNSEKQGGQGIGVSFK